MDEEDTGMADDPEQQQQRQQEEAMAATQQQEQQQAYASQSVQQAQQQQQQQQHPRPAPAYRIQTTICEKRDDGPGPRCGHTLTAVAAVGEEGSPNYVGPRLILFGGATALEGNSAAAGPQAAASAGAGIRLAGATADVHCYDVHTNKWSRLAPVGDPPSPRAAHAATAVGTMVVIQGGIGPAGLSTDDLHVLDLTQTKPRWHRWVCLWHDI
jgi:protein phosphatase